MNIKRNFGSAQNISVRGSISDYFGKVIKEYKPLSNAHIQSATKKVATYSPLLSDGVFITEFTLNSSCNDSDLSNNKASLVLSKNVQFKQNLSSFFVEEIYTGKDDVVSWGDQFTTKVIIYKGEKISTGLGRDGW